MIYLCEVCDKQEELTPNVAYANGWDYPPFIGTWGVVSPRTCPDCGMEGTAWWAAMTKQPLSEKHLATVRRITAEQAPEEE